MLIYVVVGVYKGVVDKVEGFLDPIQAEMEMARLKNEYGIVPGYEEEAENNVQLHEVEVDSRPVSMLRGRLVW